MRRTAHAIRAWAKSAWSDSSTTTRVLLGLAGVLIVVWVGAMVYLLAPPGGSGGGASSASNPDWSSSSTAAFEQGLEDGGRRGCDENFARRRIGYASDPNDPHRLSYPATPDTTYVDSDRCWTQTKWANTFTAADIADTYGSDPGAAEARAMGLAMGWNYSCDLFDSFKGGSDSLGMTESACVSANPYE
jgi:hypothetical protein